MTVAFVTGEIDKRSKVRGIGSYASNLQLHLKKIHTPLKIEFVSKADDNHNLVHYPYFDFYFHSLPIRAKSKRIVTIHDAIPLLFPEMFPAGVRGYINLLLQKLALKNVDLIICDSKSSKRDVVKKLSIDEKKVEVIYLAAGDSFAKLKNNKLANSVKSKYALPDEFCLYVGDVNWNKNISTLVSAISISSTPLVMVGSSLVNASLRQTQEVNLLIKKLGIEKLITKTGFVPESDLVAIYNLATVTIVPSFYEGFGLPVLESMACGTPVICSNNSSLAEIGADVAIYCDPSNPQDIAVKINTVIEMSSSQRQQLSQKCAAHARKFSYQKTAQQTVEAYQKVLK